MNPSLSKGQQLLYTSQANFIHQDWQADGTVIVTLSRHGDPNEIVMHVSDLYGPNETVINETVRPKVNPIIAGRITQATNAAAALNNP